MCDYVACLCVRFSVEVCLEWCDFWGCVWNVFYVFYTADILFASVSFDQLLSMFIAASRLFIVWISLSTVPEPLWSPVGASISLMFLSLQKVSKFVALNACAWSHLFDLGMPRNFICSFI